MKYFAVPVVALVQAENADDAYRKVSDTLNTHAIVRDPDVGCMLDESLNAFEYDPVTTEVHTALDDPDNLKIAKEFTL
jgi:hypothetical protein